MVAAHSQERVQSLRIILDCVLCAICTRPSIDSEYIAGRSASVVLLAVRYIESRGWGSQRVLSCFTHTHTAIERPKM